jgi:hypothetical protein
MPRFCLRRLTLRSNWSARPNSFSLAMLFIALAVPFVAGHAQQSTVQKKTRSTTKAAQKPTGDSIPDGPPLSIDFILRMLNQVKADITDEPRIIAFINKRGLDFLATQENLDRLLAAGASGDLIQLVSTLKPPPPPPPPEPVSGTLQFSCAPAECSIRVAGGPEQQTKNGKLTIDGLAFKQYTVEFRKDGFISKSERVTLSEATHPEIKVTLEVAQETRANWGRELLKAALQAVGGKAGVDELKTMTATGAASSWDTSGTLSEWNIKAAFTPNTDSYDLGNASSGSFTVVCQGETCSQKGKSLFGRKKVSGPEAASINTNIVQYNRYHLVSLFERIGAENHKLLANAPPTPGTAEQHLIVDSRDETYDITFDSALLPASVSYKSKDGLASVKVTYAQWAAFETGSRYPRHTSITLPGEKQHGIQVRYETLTSASK